MKLSRTYGGAAAFVVLLLAPSGAVAMIHCDNLVVDKHKFDISALKGPHSVVTSEMDGISRKIVNTTYTLDMCAPLKRSADVPKEEECPNGSRVCAIVHDPWKEGTKPSVGVDRVIPIAAAPVGGPLQWEAKRLSTSDLATDANKEGLRVVLKGGKYNNQEQRAIVEFLCNHTMTGLEGEWESEDKYIPGDEEKDPAMRRLLSKREEGSETQPPEGDAGWSEKQLKNDNAALIWNSFDEDGHDLRVLRLTWYTKYACENADPPPPEGGQHWGFFTWLFIIVFLATAAYLIFGSWINYTRYGARGWDLLPHGDTIRDVPYLMKDWIRRVLNTVQSSGSRGGYSAV